ncbi:MAG: hypothetical protein HYV02_04900 [Deltaproteobacteria bacterium]|nr:hypothetical protein [Deltaproteobacteria bacterium]
MRTIVIWGSLVVFLAIGCQRRAPVTPVPTPDTASLSAEAIQPPANAAEASADVAPSVSAEPAGDVADNTEAEAEPQAVDIPAPTEELNVTDAGITTPGESEMPVETAPSAVPQVTTPLLPSPPSERPPQDSRRHRTLFNQVAALYVPLQWVRDVGTPHQVDIDAEELSLPDVLRPAFGLSSEGWSETTPVRQAITVVREELERRRVHALETTVARFHPVVESPAIKHLSAADQTAVKILATMGAHIDQLYARQLHDEGPTLVADIYAAGAPHALRLLQWQGLAACERMRAGDYCSLLPTFPTIRPGGTLWPETVSSVLLDDLRAREETPNPWLSFATVVSRDEDGTLQWTPFGRMEGWHDDLHQIAQRFDELAAVEGAEALREMATAFAAAFRAETPFPFADAMAAWGRARGTIEVVAGPFATHADPWQTKGFFTFLLGVHDPDTAATLVTAYPQLRQSLESRLSGLAPQQYAARTLGAASLVRPITVLAAAGDARGLGEPTYAMPPLDALIEAGEGKRLILRNVAAAVGPLYRQLADQLLAATDREDVTAEGILSNAVAEALVSDVGPQMARDLPLAETWKTLQREVIAQWAFAFFVQHQVIDERLAAQCTMTHLVSLMHRVRQSASPVAAVQLTHLVRQGAVRLDAGEMVVDRSRLTPAYESLLREIIRVAARPESAEMATLINGYTTLLPGPIAQRLHALENVAMPQRLVVLFTPLE